MAGVSACRPKERQPATHSADLDSSREKSEPSSQLMPIRFVGHDRWLPTEKFCIGDLKPCPNQRATALP